MKKRSRLPTNSSTSCPALLGNDALDNLGLLDEEGTDDALANAVGAARATVRALDRLDALRDLRVLARAKGRDTRERDVAVTALGGSRGLLDRKVAELATRGLYDPLAVRLGRVGRAGTEGDALDHGVRLAGSAGERRRPHVLCVGSTT